MRLPRCQEAGGPQLIMAPAASAMLALAFFLLLQGNFMLQPGVSLKVPDSPFLLQPQHDPEVVSVTGVPLPQIFHGNRAVSPEELEKELRATNRTGSLIIKADRLSPYDLLLRILTLGTRCGYTVVLASGSGGS